VFRKPRALDPVECRVLGALLEKEQATPEYYPMTLSALVAATNQKTNREPVMELTEDEVREALERLFKDVLVWREAGARALKWSHNLDRRWALTPATKAAITVLLLRGPQTPGEVRGRAERLHPFASVAEAEAALAELARGDEPLARELKRFPGQKESRWRHLADLAVSHTGAAVESPPEPVSDAPPSAPAEAARDSAAGVAARPVARSAGTALEARIEAIESRLAEIESALAGLLPR
jgi:uncharacterized protein YceH (UPF0502 family)